jgi:hypothetical protein
METQEVLDKTSIAQAQLEWTHDIGIAAALDVAMKRVKDWDLLKLKITEAKHTASCSPNRDYKTGYICAMSYIEGCMAEMENEDGN